MQNCSPRPTNAIWAIAMIVVTCFGAVCARAADAMPKFSNYEVHVWKGMTRQPQFDSRDRAYREFRTRLSDGIKAGPDFAGHYTVIEIGCGSGKRSFYVGDNRTGQIFPFSMMCSGGEYKYLIEASYYLKSRLVALHWADSPHDACWTEYFEWTGKSAKLILKTRTGNYESCDDGKEFVLPYE